MTSPRACGYSVRLNYLWEGAVLPTKIIASVIGLLALASVSNADHLQLETGDHICLVGNELGERMQHQNFWETLLHSKYPEKQLVVRNLCFPGDEVDLRIRIKNFGDPDKHLTHSKASVVLFFFGFNESFDGMEGIDEYKKNLTELLSETKKKDYSGKGAPRMVLVSPIAFENTGDKHLPDGSEHNAQLAAYTKAMGEVAKANDVEFVDLYTPTKALFEKEDAQLTSNGSHLNAAGYKALAPIFLSCLVGGEASGTIDSNVKAEVDDKNFHWWHRYRAVNGFSIYGDRGKAGQDGSRTMNNEDVMERERAILDQMAATRDARIWAVAKGDSVADKPDDSKTLPFLEPTTNVGGPDDKQAKAGKLGTLDYLSSADQLPLFKLHAGFEINLVASEEQFPELANPVSLQFDNKGRLWVSTMASYPHWKPKSELDDKLLIFEDKNKDGKADECKVFARGLHQPTGFEIGHGGAYVAQQPDILFIKDEDGDDKEDSRVRKLVGFCTADSHHGICAFEWGPGGNLYFNEGTFKYSQVESPYGLTRLQEGGIWYYNPRSHKFGAHVSLTFSNPWGHVFDPWGQNFIGDASPGNSYWAAPISGHVAYPDKHPGGGHHSRLHPDTGGGEGYGKNYRFPTFYKKRIRPSAGCAMVSSRHFPDDMQGNFLVTNCIGERTVLNHKVMEKDSGFEGKEVPPIVSCEDGNFRPVDLQFAPDGSLYIVDWHNALIGHLQHNLRDPSRDHSHGRIWRVTYKDKPLLTPPTIDGAPVKDLLELLKVYEDRTRYRVKRELAARPSEEVLPALKEWTANLAKSKDENTHHLLESLWMYQTHNAVEQDLLNHLLNCDDHRARAAAVRVLSFWIDRVDTPLDLLAPRVKDEHPRVKLEAVRALSFLEGEEAIEMALEVLPEDDKELDTYLQYTLDETMRTLEK